MAASLKTYLGKTHPCEKPRQEKSTTKLQKSLMFLHHSPIVQVLILQTKFKQNV